METVPPSESADKPANNRSGYHGVRWDPRAGKWAAYVHHDKHFYHLGLFTDVIAAAQARDAKAIELHGGRLAMNFPDPILLGYQYQEDGSALLPLTRGAFAIIDADDVPRVLPHRWHLVPTNKAVYAMARMRDADGSKRMVLLHCFIFPTTNNREVDHIDRNGLNCRKSNLREATHSQNTANKALTTANTSGYKGVSWAKKSGKWYAGIKCNGKSINLGHYERIEDAARAYDAKAREFFGEFAHANFTD